MAYGLVGERIRLTPVDVEKHLAGCTRWLNDKAVTAGMSLGAFPLTEYAERQYLENVAKGSQTDVVFAIELLEDGRHIGMSGIHGISWVNRSATTGTLIGEQELWGQGYGSEQAKMRARYAFEVLNLRVLYSMCLSPNTGSLKMQQAAGYEVWGTQPKAMYKSGQYLDLIHTVLFRERWEELVKGS